MRRSMEVRHPHSVSLFKFSHKVLTYRRGGRVNNQEIGDILGFNPSGCSHWKRGMKNVKSVFSLQKLAADLKVDLSLLFDVTSGLTSLDEAYYEFLQSEHISKLTERGTDVPRNTMDRTYAKIETFVAQLHKKAGFSQPPLYLPEVLRFFSFISTRQGEMVDKLSRILRIRSSHYVIQYKTGNLSPQTRLSMTNDLAKIIFEAERARFPELGPFAEELLEYEKLFFVASLLCPQKRLSLEMKKVDPKINLTSELLGIFWVPKTLISYQLKALLTRLYLGSQVGIFPLEKSSQSEVSEDL